MTETRPRNPNTISREAVVRAARLAIKDAREKTEVSPALARKIMRVARTAPRICGDWRSRDNSCGCLIGTLRANLVVGRNFFASDSLEDAEFSVGSAFLHRLADEVPNSRFKSGPRKGEVKDFVFSDGLDVVD